MNYASEPGCSAQPSGEGVREELFRKYEDIMSKINPLIDFVSSLSDELQKVLLNAIKRAFSNHGFVPLDDELLEYLATQSNNLETAAIKYLMFILGQYNKEVMSEAGKGEVNLNNIIITYDACINRLDAIKAIVCTIVELTGNEQPAKMLEKKY